MHGSLDPEERIFEPNSTATIVPDWYTQIVDAVTKLEWCNGDEITIEIAGSSTYEIDGAGTKWAPKKGTVKYNKDAFIVIKNRDRNPTVSSQPNPELKAHHDKS